MAERPLETHGFSKPSLSAFSTPSEPPGSSLPHLGIGLTELTDDIASLQKQTVSLSSQSQPKPSTPHVQSAHSTRSNTAAICWYHTTFGSKAHHCIFPCLFTFKHSKRVKRVSPKLIVAVPRAVNTSPITTFLNCSLSLDIGLRRLFSRVFVVADISRVIVGEDFLSTLDPLFDCRQSHLHDKTANLTVLDISISCPSPQLAVLDPEPENQFWQPLAE
ncbi:hypothetical protein SprV_0301191100 [Sparganum proliferum]